MEGQGCGLIAPPIRVAGNFSLALFSMFQVRETARAGAPSLSARRSPLDSPLSFGQPRRRVGGATEPRPRLLFLQVCTGDGWAAFIARPLMGISTEASSNETVVDRSGDPPNMNRLIGIFFMGFYFAAGICLLGVVHAILLDEFMLAMQVKAYRVGLHLRDEQVVRVQCSVHSCARYSDALHSIPYIERESMRRHRKPTLARTLVFTRVE